MAAIGNEHPKRPGVWALGLGWCCVLPAQELALGFFGRAVRRAFMRAALIDYSRVINPALCDFSNGRFRPRSVSKRSSGSP